MSVKTASPGFRLSDSRFRSADAPSREGREGGVGGVDIPGAVGRK